jgi:branched-chain amino acid transport system substrate-binding protein
MVVGSAIAAGACGSRLPEERLVAAARAGSSAAQAGHERATDVVAGEQGAPSEAAIADPGTPTTTAHASSEDAHGDAAGSGPSADPVAPAGARCTAPKSELRIGAVGEMSGVVGSVLADSPKAVQAWVASVNASGGINCHPIKYFVADDGGDPSRNQAIVKQMVEQDHVVAFVQMVAPLAGQASVDYLTRKGIPVIGDGDGEPWFYDSPMYFPQVSSGDGLILAAYAAAGTAARAAGKQNLAVLTCVEAQVCKRAYELAASYATKFGMKVVHRSQASLAQPDFTSICLDAKSAGADIFFVGMDANSTVRLARSCRAVNYTPQYAMVASSNGPQVQSDPNLDGAVIGSVTIPWFFTANPAVVEYQTTLKRFGPGVPVNPASLIGWVSAKLFELATRNLPDPPTSQAILDGLWSIKNDDLGGLTGPLTFTKGQNAPKQFCYWLVQIKGGQYVTPNGAERACA